jgi:glutaredoxin-like protein NrdH
MKSITVYTQPGCQPCRAVKRWLDKRGIEHQTVDVTLSPGDAEALKALGYSGTPVTIVSNGDPETDLHWHGFNPDFLSRYCEEQS